MPINATITMPELTYDMDSGVLHWGDHEIPGIASRNMVEVATVDVSEGLQYRISELENIVWELQNRFTADLVKELVSRCEQFVSDRELTGQTDEEFETEIRDLLFGGGM